MSAQYTDKTTKSLEFRMCKKIAELTQVVEMLFTRNREKDVLIEAVKKSYEHEIELVLKDAKGRIGSLERSLADTKWRGIQDLEQAVLAKESEWRHKVAHYEQHLQDEKSESQNLRDLLISAQRDIENLRQGATDRMVFQAQEISRRDKELEKLRDQTAAAESKLKNEMQNAQAVIADLRVSKEKLEKEVSHLREAIDSSQKILDQVVTRNKALENDINILRRELNKATNSQLRTTVTSQDSSEELKRLRREVQRYRLELSNREHNFNRMFCDKQPLITNKKRNEAALKGSSKILHLSRNDYSPLSVNEMRSADCHRQVAYAKIYAFVKERQGMLNVDDQSVKMNNQSLLSLRSLSQKSILDDSKNDDIKHGKDTTLPPQGSTSVHERLINEEIDQFKSTLQHPGGESQVLLQKMACTEDSEKADSSGLPSITPTPPHRQAPTQPTRPPKPFGREVFCER